MGPGVCPTVLSADLTEIVSEYAAVLADAPLSPESRRTYLSRVRMYLAWLGQHGPPAHPGRSDHQPPSPATGRCATTGSGCCATGLTSAASSTPNSALTAIDDFYLRRGLGKVAIERDELPETAPRALEEQARIRWLRAVEAHLSPRDRTLALIPYYAGARISEVVRLESTTSTAQPARPSYGSGAKAANPARSTSTKNFGPSLTNGSRSAQLAQRRPQRGAVPQH